MKRRIRPIVLLVLCLGLLLLCSCSHESKFVGTWAGDGTLDVKAISAPFEYATQLVFQEDGFLTVTVNGVDQTFGYKASNDTLTVNGKEKSWGVSYTIKGSTLTITTGGGSYAVFTKTN